MAILNRFICSKHGEFDAWSDADVRCPAAKCRCKPRQMVSAPAVHRDGATAKTDKTLNQLAVDFKMTNIKSTREGENQAGYYTRNNKKEPRPGDAAIWGNTGSINMQTVMGGGAFRSVRGEQIGVRADQMPRNQPKTASYMADHENLKIKT